MQPSGPSSWPVDVPDPQLVAVGGESVFAAVRSEKRGLNVSEHAPDAGQLVGVVPRISKSMKPWSTSVAPGPNWSSVIASLSQKMLLNSARGCENPGRVAAFGNCVVYRESVCQSGSFASVPRPAAWGTPSAEFSDEPVETLFATVLLTIDTFDESS